MSTTKNSGGRNYSTRELAHLRPPCSHQTRPHDVGREEFEALQRQQVATLQQVAALQQQVADLRAAEAKRLRPTIEILARLLPALAGSFGSTSWLASEALRTQALTPLLEGWSVGRLGVFLQRATGIVVEGRMLTRGSREGHAVLWSVVGVEES